MPDPIDWGLVLESPVFWGAVMTFLGIALGHWVSRGSKREENELAGLKASVDVLRAEYSRLNEEVKELRAKMDAQEKRYRILAEKYSTAQAYIQSLVTAARGLFARLDAENIPHGDIPQPPEIIAVDMTPLQE